MLPIMTLVGFVLTFYGFAGSEVDKDQPVLGIIGTGLCLVGTIGLMFLAM